MHPLLLEIHNLEYSLAIYQIIDIIPLIRY